MKYLLILFILMISTPAAYSQVSTGPEWQNIAGPKDDLLFSLPPDFIVNNQGKRISLFGFAEGAGIEIHIDMTGNPRGQLSWYNPSMGRPDSTTTQFEKEKFVGFLVETKKDKSRSSAIYLASKKAFYRIFVSSRSGDNQAFVRFLFSIRLNGDPLFKQDKPISPDADSIISAAELKTSPEVIAALRVKDAKDVEIKYDLREQKAPDAEEKEVSVPDAVISQDSGNFAPEHSRGLIFLNKPHPVYTSGARSSNISGTVNLRVLFRSDGSIGQITVVKELGGGLTERAVEAARKIKFLPAQKDGKRIDMIRTIQYTFTIY